MNDSPPPNDPYRNPYPANSANDRQDDFGRDPLDGPPLPPPNQPRAIIFEPQAERPLVTYVIIGITVLVYIGQMIGETFLGGDIVAYYGMKINEFIRAGELWRLFTPMLLHGSLLHIGFNMYALNVLGPELEKQMGHIRFLLLYVVAGFAGNVFSLIFSTAPSLGASTSIFGLLAAQGVFVYQNREIIGSRAQAVLRSILTIAGINFFIGLSPGIDNWGHLGGFIGGAMFMWLAGPLLTAESTFPVIRLRDTREDPDGFRALLSVGLIFVLLAGWSIVFQ